MASHYYNIAGFRLCINFAEGCTDGTFLIPSFTPFLIDDCRQTYGAEPLLFSLTVDNTLRPIPKSERERIRVFDTGNGDTAVDRLADGGYQFIISNIMGDNCALLITNHDFTKCKCALRGNEGMRTFGLNNALMLTYAFAGSFHQTLLIHASLVRHNGKGYAFIAKSGTGKSTQVSMWLRAIPNCDLMNDDNPIVRIIDGKAFIYGSPWSGKTPCYRNVCAPLGAITRIDRAAENSVDRLSTIEALVSLLPACSTMKWEHDIYNGTCATISKLIETTGIYTLHCLPNEDAARVCHKAIVTED